MTKTELTALNRKLIAFLEKLMRDSDSNGFVRSAAAERQYRRAKRLVLEAKKD